MGAYGFKPAYKASGVKPPIGEKYQYYAWRKDARTRPLARGRFSLDMVGDPQQVLRVMSRNIDTLSTVEPYRIAKAVEVYAKEFVPKDTWHLHDNIRAEGHRVVADTEYAWYVEYGTKKMKEQPYMRPAIEAAKQLFDTTSVTAAFGAGM